MIEWKLIDSAPTGKDILLHVPGHVPDIFMGIYIVDNEDDIGYWQYSDEELAYHNSHIDGDPTHWARHNKPEIES